MRRRSVLDPRKRYLQVALNGTLADAKRVIALLPPSDRIIVEAGTPFIKRYGVSGIRQLRDWWSARLLGNALPENADAATEQLIAAYPALRLFMKQPPAARGVGVVPQAYIVADLKTMDRGETEAEIAKEGGASAAVALGSAPTETLNAFVAACEARGLDAMIDMMNVEQPLSILRKLRRMPAVVILHRGVDEEHYNREKHLPLHEIRRITGGSDVMIAIAGGDTPREVQRAAFNDADIIVVWKTVLEGSNETTGIVEGFLRDIK